MCLLCSKRGKINGPVRKTNSSVLVAYNPVQHQRTPFANFRNRSHLAVRKTHHGGASVKHKKARNRNSMATSKQQGQLVQTVIEAVLSPDTNRTHRGGLVRSVMMCFSNGKMRTILNICETCFSHVHGVVCHQNRGLVFL